MELTELNVRKILQWCIERFGSSSPNATTPPEIRCLTWKYHDGGINLGTEGEYEPELNRITIYYGAIMRINPATALYTAIEAVIHEFTHFLQDLRFYNIYNSLYGYVNNPLEVQARQMSVNYAKQCYRDLFFSGE